MPEEKTRFEISADELESRMEKKQKLHDEPLQKAVEILTAALSKVMTSLGVDCEQPDEVIHAQQEDLGIIVTEETREEMAGLNGYFVFLRKGENDYIPIAWVGGARMNHLGECFCDINWFNDERLTEFGGVKLIQ